MEEKKGCDNRQACICPEKACLQHGKCCECVAQHRLNGNLPVCLRETKTK